MIATSIVVTAAVRCSLVVLFLPFSALDKVLNFRQAVGQAATATANGRVASALIVAGLCTEVCMSVAIVSGIADRLAAFVMAGYCVLTALLWKQFWKMPDFKLRGVSLGRDTFWDFLKNIAVAGGFLLVTFGIRSSEVDRFLAHPLGSTHPYTTRSQVLERCDGTWT